MEQQRRHEEQNLPHPPPGAAPISFLSRKSATARHIRGRAHVEKISRDAEALGFTGTNSARALGAQMPADTGILGIPSGNPPPGAIDAALRAQARKLQPRDSSTVRIDDDSARRPSFSGIERALKRHSARRKVPPSEVARIMAEEKLSTLSATQQPEGELQQEQQSQAKPQPCPPKSRAAEGTAVPPPSTTSGAYSGCSETSTGVVTGSATGVSGPLGTSDLAVKTSATAPTGADRETSGATSTRRHDPPPRPKGRGRVSTTGAS
jgi:hypothetical protein